LDASGQVPDVLIMAESTTTGQITEAEWKAARDAGLLFAAPGTNAQDKAIHAFAEAMRAEGYAAAIEFIATGERA
jgi:hypothetical protein